MSELGDLFSSVVELFQLEFTVFGFTFSLWQVFLLDIVICICCFVLREVFLGE